MFLCVELQVKKTYLVENEKEPVNMKNKRKTMLKWSKYTH